MPSRARVVGALVIAAALGTVVGAAWASAEVMSREQRVPVTVQSPAAR